MNRVASLLTTLVLVAFPAMLGEAISPPLQCPTSVVFRTSLSDADVAAVRKWFAGPNGACLAASSDRLSRPPS